MRSPELSGFSLVELLIVIGIMAMLAALLFPIFDSAHKAAYRTTCCSNQRQIAFTIIAQSYDNGGKMPTSDSVWSELNIDHRILHCPTDMSSSPISYVYNGNLSGQKIGQDGWTLDPSKILLTADGSGTNNIAVKRSDVELRHARLAVAAYADGHVQLVDFPRVCHAWVGNIQYEPVPFTGNMRYAVSADPVGTTVTCTGGKDADWSQAMKSNAITDVPMGSYCCLRFKYANPGHVIQLGISESPPAVSQAFTTYTNAGQANFAMISLWEDPPANFVRTLPFIYTTTDEYAVERLPDGTVNYLINDEIVYTSSSKTHGVLQFNVNAYNLGAGVTGIRYVSEIE